MGTHDTFLWILRKTECWRPAVADVPAGFYAVAGVPAGFYAVADVPAGFYAVYDVPAGFYAVAGVPAVHGVPGVASVPVLAGVPAVVGMPSFHRSHCWDVPLAYCCQSLCYCWRSCSCKHSFECWRPCSCWLPYYHNQTGEFEQENYRPANSIITLVIRSSEVYSNFDPMKKIMFWKYLLGIKVKIKVNKNFS